MPCGVQRRAPWAGASIGGLGQSVGVLSALSSSSESYRVHRQSGSSSFPNCAMLDSLVETLPCIRRHSTYTA